MDEGGVRQDVEGRQLPQGVAPLQRNEHLCVAARSSLLYPSSQPDTPL